MTEKIEWYKEVLELEPNSKVFFPLGRLLAEDNQTEEAIATLEDGLKRHPEFLEARLYLIELLHKNGYNEECGAQVDKLSKMFASYAGFWQAWAACLSSEKEADTASILRFLAAQFVAGPIQLHDVLNRGLETFINEAVPQGAREMAPKPAPVSLENVAEPVIADEPVLEPMAEKAAEQPEPVAELPNDDFSADETMAAETADALQVETVELPEEDLELPESLSAELDAENLADAPQPVETQAFVQEEIAPEAMPETLADASLEMESEALVAEVEAISAEAELPVMEEEETPLPQPVASAAEELAPEPEDSLPMPEPALEAPAGPELELGLDSIEDELPVVEDEVQVEPAMPAEDADLPVMDEPAEAVDATAPRVVSAPLNAAEESILNVGAAIDNLDLPAMAEGFEEELPLADLAEAAVSPSLPEPAPEAVMEVSPELVEPEPVPETTPEPAMETGPTLEAIPEPAREVARPRAAASFDEVEDVDALDDAEAGEPISLRTRSMAEVLAEQGDIRGALDIYHELAASAANADEADDIKRRIATLEGRLRVNPPQEEYYEPEHSSPSRDRLIGMLEALANRVEARANS